jgi:hypothetical protein
MEPTQTPEHVYVSADEDMVEDLIVAICKAVENTCIPDVTTPADVLSALFTTLNKFLLRVKEGQTPTEQAYNAREVNRVLMDLLMMHGSVIH